MTFTLKNICAVTAVLHFVCLLYNCFILMRAKRGVRPVLSHRAVVDVELSGSELFYCFFDPQPLPTSPTKNSCFTTTSLKLWLVTSRFALNSGLSGGLSRCR